MKGIVHLFFVKGKVTRNMGKLTLKWHFDLYFDFWFIDSIIYFFDAFFSSSSDSFLSLCLCLISFINVWFIYLPKKDIQNMGKFYLEDRDDFLVNLRLFENFPYSVSDAFPSCMVPTSSRPVYQHIQTTQ